MPNHRNMLAAIALIGLAQPASADVITDWNEKAVAFGVSRNMGPPPAERIIAMIHVAMFDAVNSIERKYRPYLVQLPAEATASKEAAAAAAAGTVLAGVNPQAQAEMKAMLAAYLAAIPDSAAKADGIKLGEAVAAKILEARANDGARRAGHLPAAHHRRRLCADRSHLGAAVARREAVRHDQRSQFRPVAPIALTSKEWAADYNEIKELGGRTSTKRSARQTEDARFWLAVDGRVYYPVIRTLATAKKLSVDRQRAAVRAHRGRQGRCPDRGVRRQVPLRLLASGHRHPQRRHRRQSGHRARRRLAADRRDADASGIPVRALHREREPRRRGRGGVRHGGDSGGFDDEPDAARRHPPLDQRARLLRRGVEARIWAGFHYRFSINVGQDMGRKIGEYVVKNFMQPVDVATR